MACPKDCRRCSLQQHAFCSASIGLANMQLMESLIKACDRQNERIESLQAELQTLKHSENLAMPMQQATLQEEKDDIAQSESGAE